MTSAQTTAVLNATTTLQGRIDTVLATPDLDWDDDSGWQPGDPLYERPDPDARDDDQYVRPMFQVIDDRWPAYPRRCGSCEVAWQGPEACWMCGDPKTGWFTRRPRRTR